MFGDITEDVKAHIEKTVSAKMDSLNDPISGMYLRIRRDKRQGSVWCCEGAI